MYNKQNNNTIFVTTALDYANGDLHLGHILEKIQADIWVRWQRILGKDCVFICGDDAHGTPIMLKAKQQNLKPEQLIANYYARHQADLKNFNISFDNFYTTHSAENQQLVNEIYNKLLTNGDIEIREIEQYFDTVENIFLPDRYIKGQCPRCNALDQYGDNCESCGAHYDAFELKNPISVLSNLPPVTKKSTHYFFKLSNYWEFLKTWVAEHKVHDAILHKLNEWLHKKENLQSWDISRDAPYFGFLIPGTTDKYFYVWLDAPVGYLSILKNFYNKQNKQNKQDTIIFNNLLSQNSTNEIYHFIGKDIIYFHALFWPAMLRGTNYRTPTKIFTHGFLTINGEKMSKSRGTFITARQYIDNLPAEFLRYYFAAKLTDTIDDLDLNFSDLVARVNSDLVGKFVNIASRCAKFINNNFANRLANDLHDLPLYQQFIEPKYAISELFINLNYSKAIREIMNLADVANRYIDDNKPWLLIKDPNNVSLVQQICTTGINLFRILMIYLQPVLPQTAKLVEKFLDTQLNFNNLEQPLLNCVIAGFKPLINRIDMEQINNMLTNNTNNNVNNSIDIEDFAKIDLRVAKIINAEHIEEADKLLKLTLDVGSLGIKQVFAGIKSAYEPLQLINKYTVVVANLKERKMRFGVSQGMVLAASGDNKDGKLWLLEPDLGAEPGMKIK